MEGRNSKTQIINTTMTFTSLKFKKHFTHSHPSLIPDPCSFAYNSTMIYGFSYFNFDEFYLKPQFPIPDPMPHHSTTIYGFS